MHQSIDKKNKITIYLLLLFILSTTNGRFIENTSSHSSAVSKINIEGLSRTENLKIINELNILLNRNILLIKKKEINKVMSRYNIIEEYRVKKVYPSMININIKPTKLVARISNNNQLLVGSNGKLIKDKINKEKLPYIFGEFNSEEFLFFKKNIDQSKFIFTEFKALYFFPSKRWDILTNKGILIKLPHDNFFKSLNLAYKVISKNNFKNINLIDLRMKNHLITKNE